MEKKNYLILNDEFLKYCELNNVTNIEKLAIDTFNSGFNLLKYGSSPFSSQKDSIEKDLIQYDLKKSVSDIETLKKENEELTKQLIELKKKKKPDNLYDE